MYVSESENRLITGSVDCHVKIYDLSEVVSVQQFKVVNQLKFQKPITGLTFTNDMSHFCVGMADGSLTVSKNKEKEAKNVTLDDTAFLLNLESKDEALDYKYFFRGIYVNKPTSSTDDLVETKRSLKLSNYDSKLK